MSVEIRREAEVDILAIREVNRRAFDREIEARLVDDLRGEGYARLSLVAEEGGRIVGHIMFSEAEIRTERGALAALSLGPVAVIPERRGQGIGSALVKEGLGQCTKTPYRSVFLLGFPGYYTRFGFSADLAANLSSAYSGEAFMALELVPGALAGVTGEFEFAPPVRGGVVTCIFDAAETASRLRYPKLADSIRDVALAMGSGELQAPPRLVLPLQEGGVLLVMPASDQEISITKLVTVHPENPGRGLPNIQGEVVVMDAATGERLGLLDGSVVTARRTAALSMLAARKLAPHRGGPLLVVGAGTQGRSHLDAFREGLGVSKVFISSRTADSTTSLADHAGNLGMDAEAVERPEEVLAEVSLVVTATTSREPVLPDEVPHGTFVAAVGSFEPEAAELPPALISTSQVFVDTMEGAKDEAGDLIQAAQAGAFRWEDATALEDALRSSGRPEGTVVFKSVGHALWDLAAARTAFVDPPGSDTS